MRDRVMDPALTDLGHRQAQAVAQHLATGINPEMSIGMSEEDTSVRRRQGYGITRLYCSAMHRALQTAQPIGQALNLAPEVWIDLHEHGGIYLDHGPEGGLVGYPGRTRSEILAEFPNFVLPDEITDAGWWNRGHEDWPACQGRAIRVAGQLRELAEQIDQNERVAMVSHGGFLAVLLKALLNHLPGSDIFYHHFNTAITRLDFQSNGKLDVRYLNRIPHLSPELVS
jgi:2,3-bisphosphoglycerate-dependent phosphoglycerate mutase/probable phosphoglycerate mutase